MGLFKFGLVLLIGIFILGLSTCSPVATSFKNNGIVPDVVSTAPNVEVNAKYNGVSVHLGNELTPSQVKNMPNVDWTPEPNTYYTLALVDPDVPSRANPRDAEIVHWLVGNIPGSNVTWGEVLVEYNGSMPSKGTGIHRYVFLVYKQSNLMKFPPMYISRESEESRSGFSIRDFAKENNLGEPVAGNFFVAQYEE